MKNSKKTWGILGTSMGSMLIIVALLTMVGMGSSDTYAADTTCKCPTGYNPSKGQCAKEVTETKTCSANSQGAKVAGYDSTGKIVYKCTTTETKTTPCGTDTDPDPGSGSGSGSGTNSGVKTCDAGKYYRGNGTCYGCPAGSYCPAGSLGAISCPPGTTSAAGSSSESDCKATGDRPLTCKSSQYVQANHCADCPVKATCDGQTFTCEKGYKPSGNACVSDGSLTGDPNDETKDPTGNEKPTCSPVGSECEIRTGKKGICTLVSGRALCLATTTGDDDNPSNPNKPTGGDDKPNNPNKPSGGGDDGLGGNGGGNSGGNSGGNGNGGNAGGNNGNNNGGNNATKNPNTATKAPLVIALIGIMSVGISTVVYFKGKKEINTEI